MTDDDEPLAIMGSTSSLKTMADGSLRIAIDVSPKESKPAFQLFGTPGTAVALAVIKNEVAVEHDRPKPGEITWVDSGDLGDEGKRTKIYGSSHTTHLKTEFGEYARALKLSDFFRTPIVWRAVGTDEEYLKWLRGMPSALSGEFSEHHMESGESFSIPAHVRRVEHGSGTAIKPPYSAIPLTRIEHDKAHQQGDSAIGTEEWWAKERINYVSTWCWATLKKALFYESWADMPPGDLAKWAKKKDVVKYLPSMYQAYVDAESQTSSEA